MYVKKKKITPYIQFSIMRGKIENNSYGGKSL